MDALFNLKDLIDIILFAFFFYTLFRLMKASGSINIFLGIVTIVIVWIVVSKVLEMRLMGSFMDSLVNVGAIILVVIFQEEIRRFLVNLGSHKRWKYMMNLFLPEQTVQEEISMMEYVIASRNMAKNRVGALIVIEGNIDLKTYMLTGEKIDGVVSVRLLESLFFKNSPLHDGAVIISNNRIMAAGCILPVSHSTDLPKEMGLRHRAGHGISKETDAKVIVVSEERGRISFFHQGKMHRNISEQELETLLTKSN